MASYSGSDTLDESGEGRGRLRAVAEGARLEGLGALTGAGAGDDGEAQGVPGAAQNLSQLPVGQGHHRAALHRLQPISGPDLTALGRRAASTHRHEPMREKRRGW